MDKKPPLTVEELREIGQRRKGDADIKALLWEIKRLRDESDQLQKNSKRDYAIISRCYQIARSLPETGGILKLLFDDLKNKLEGHPVREYQDSITPFLRGEVDVKPGDNDPD